MPFSKRTATDQSVPDAPFKKSWPELALKHAVRYAAENGFDRVAWTTGEQQFQRYGSQHIAWKKAGAGWTVFAKEQVGGEADGMNIEQEADLQGVNWTSEEEVSDKAGLRKMVEGVMHREKSAWSAENWTPNGHRYT